MVFTQSKKEWRNRLFNVPTRFLADRLFACGRDAGRFWYGDDKNFTVLPNAINCSAYEFTEEKDLTHAANSDSARTNWSSDMLAEWLLRRRTTHILCVCLLK